MSETDDTDDLLLIPPDLFTGQIAAARNLLDADPYFEIVDSLIGQVHRLEDKVNSITGSEADLINSDYGGMEPGRKYASTDDLLTERGADVSSFSTPQKPRVVYRRREEKCLESAGFSPQKHKKMLEDIEVYINSSARFNGNNKGNYADGKRGVEFSNDSRLNRNESSKYTGDTRNRRNHYAVDNSRNTNESSNFRITNVGNNYAEGNYQNTNENCPEVNCFVEDKFTGRSRGENFSATSKASSNNTENGEHSSKPVFRNQSTRSGPLSTDGRRPDVRTRINFERKLDRIGEVELDAVLREVESRKADLGAGIRFLYASPLDNAESTLGDKSASGSSGSESTQTTAYNRNPQTGEPGKLLSLSELWGRNSKDSFKQKLQEERLRREHCEELIRELQTKVLELQERVAVALKVDEAKDGALTKFHDAWDKLIFQYKMLDSERESLENENRELRERKAADINEFSNKLEQVEEELAKTRISVQSDQERFTSTQAENAELRHRLSQAESDYKRLEQLHEEQVEKNRIVNEILAQKEIEMKEHKAILTESRNEVCQCRDAIDLCQTEFTQMKQQYTQLEQILEGKQKQINDLETQRRNVSHDNENLKLIQRNLQEELLRVRDSTEKTKIELRNFYQDQVEIVVRDKLREFQSQLDKTETCLQEEIKTREMNVAKTAASHIHQLTEKHNLEVNLLEEKHREEVKLYQVQLTRSQQQLEQSAVRVKRLTDTRNTVLQQLKKVMEAQWNEALKIVNDGRSPVNVHESTIDRLHHLKTKSYSNLEEVLSDNKLDENNCGCSNGSSAELNFDLPQTTPVTSKRGFKGPRQIENDLQNYVQMLLSKQGENPEKDNSSDEKMMSQDDAAKYKQSRKGMKPPPPWK